MTRRQHKREQKKRREAKELQPVVLDGRKVAKKLGLTPYPVKYGVVDYEEMIQAAAYDGFQERWPHWKWGRQYVQLSTQNTYTPMHIYELVVNDNPAQAYLQESNTLDDQKAVITHVEAHSDFFKNNHYYKELANSMEATDMLSRHADRIQDIIENNEVTRSEVEEWIDNILCIQENIDQTSTLYREDGDESEGGSQSRDEIEDKLSDAGFSEEMMDEIISEEMLTEDEEVEGDIETDLLYFLYKYGMQYNEETEKAEEYEDWQQEIISILRKEMFYFAPQRMTKCMNEGWAAFWESRMMSHLNFVEPDGLVNYADHFASVVSSEGMNPYAIGLNLWEYVENKANREEVVTKLLQVENVDPDVFFDRIDLDKVIERLEPNDVYFTVSADTLDEFVETLDNEKLDMEGVEAARNGEFDPSTNVWRMLSYEGLAELLYSLTLHHNTTFLEDIQRGEVESLWRLIDPSERDAYETVPEALADVEYTVGWETMRDERAIHNDSTFINKYLTQEFVDESGYFTYDYDEENDAYRVSSTDAKDVKNKFLIEFTNFGKPQVVVEDHNYKNRNELLLRHEFNGINLDVPQAKDTLERVFKLYGRPVQIKTVHRQMTRDGEQFQPLLLKYDGNKFTEKDIADKEVEELLDRKNDYDTTPDDW